MIWNISFAWDVLKREKEIIDDFSHDKYSVPVLEINARPQEIMLAREEKLVLEPIGFGSYILGILGAALILAGVAMLVYCWWNIYRENGVRSG